MQRAFASASRMASRLFFLDPFAHRQFDDPNYAGPRIAFDKGQFIERLNGMVWTLERVID